MNEGNRQAAASQTEPWMCERCALPAARPCTTLCQRSPRQCGLCYVFTLCQIGAGLGLDSVGQRQAMRWLRSQLYVCVLCVRGSFALPDPPSRRASVCR